MEKKHFKAIIQNGYQILQTPEGERINCLTKTKIIQDVEKEAECVFSLLVNYKSSTEQQPFNYDPDTNKLSTPSGEVLDVEILNYRPETSTMMPEITARCTVIFPYETNHKQPFENRSDEHFFKTVFGQVI